MLNLPCDLGSTCSIRHVPDHGASTATTANYASRIARGSSCAFIADPCHHFGQVTREPGSPLSFRTTRRNAASVPPTDTFLSL